MTSDILNDNCPDRSPCLTCPRRDMDKNNCALLCLRLAAYNSGEPWEGKPLPYIIKQSKEGNKMEDKSQKSEVGSQMSMEEQTLINTPAEKGAAGIAQQSKACVICHDPDKKILNKRSQTCGACYQAWNVGKVNHPTLGKFKPSLTKSKITKTKGPEARGRRSEIGKDQRLEIRSQNSPLERGRREADGVCKSSDNQQPIGLIINLDNYLKIKSAVYDTAEKYFVTPEHVIIGLLGEALAGRNQKSEIRGQGSEGK